MDLRDYIHRRCSDLLVMERDIWQLSSLMAQESGHPELKRFFERHNAPRRQQISNLEQIVDALGGILGPLEYPVTQSVRRLQRAFLETAPPPALIDLHNALESAKLLHLELATYTGLIGMAKELAEDDMARLLEANRRTAEEMRIALDALLPDIIRDSGEQLRFAA